MPRCGRRLTAQETRGTPSVENDSKEDDRGLVRAAQRGDRKAFSQLVAKTQRRSYAVALQLVHDADEARDVCQEAYLKAHRNLDKFDGQAQFSTWLYRIVVNTGIDFLRRRRGEKIEFDDARDPDDDNDSGISPRRLGFDPGRAFEDRELRQQLNAALAQLSPIHRAILVMREVDGLSYQEMADILSIQIGTVMSRLFHARKRMQSLLLAYRLAQDTAA